MVSQHLKVLSEQNIVFLKEWVRKLFTRLLSLRLKLYWFSCMHYFANSSKNILAKIDVFSKKDIFNYETRQVFNSG